MSLREDLEIGPADTQKAYDEANRYEFMGRRLEPWTLRRHSVALQMGSRIMRGMNDENDSVSLFLADGFYPHVVHDLVVLLYLMHLDKKEIVQLEALPGTEATEKAYDWAEQIPLEYGSPAFFEGCKVMGRILRGILVSWPQVKKSDSNANGEKKILPVATERPGSLNYSPAQSEPADSTPSIA